MIHEPKKLTEALDTVISEFKKFRLDAAVGRSEQLKCEKCGAKFVPHLMKPLTICDKCADSFAL